MELTFLIKLPSVFQAYVEEKMGLYKFGGIWVQIICH